MNTSEINGIMRRGQSLHACFLVSLSVCLLACHVYLTESGRGQGGLERACMHTPVRARVCVPASVSECKCVCVNV